MKNDVDVLTLSVLSERVQEKTGIDADSIKKTANLLFDLIVKETAENESFKLQGFGTFKKIFVAASDGRNPQTNMTIEIPSHYKVKFIPAPSFALIINKPYAGLKPKILSEDTAAEEKKNQTGAPLIKSQPVKKDTMMPAVPESVLQPEQIQKGEFQKQTAVEPPPAASHVQNKQTGEPASQTVINQTIQHAVIEHQIIRQQIVQQQIINQTIFPDDRKNKDDDEFDPDYDTDDDDERYVNRCWFFAGIAVVLTVLVLITFVLALIHGTGKTAAVKTPVEKRTVSPSQLSVSKTAADDNVYAALAKTQYGIRSLWPYIFSANMLRYPDPDKPGAVKNLVIPAKPDMETDRKDIELSVIDVYDAYRALIAKQPKGKAAVIRREHAVMALICGESLCNGFIDKYAVRFDRTDVKTARELIKKAGTR
jgi:nucleoid DNA-binding protein